MKKCFALLTVMLLLLSLIPAVALAEGIRFSIDDGNVYEGMDKSYQDGYVPKVKSGVATIVIPLVASGEISGNAITATPGLGDPSSSPFVFKNYQKTVTLADNPVGDGSTTVSSYLVRFDLPLKSGRFNGVYPVTVTIEAQDGEGNAIEQAFTSFVTVTDGKNPNATPKPEKPVPAPKVIISGYGMDPSPAVAGEEFTATITLRNTSETQAVQNMTATVSCDSPDFLLLNDSSTIFVGDIAKDGTADVQLRYKTGLDTPARQYSISLSIQYENANASGYSSSGSVPVIVSQPLRVQMEKPKIAADVNAGDTLPLEFQVMNLGRGTVYNVRVELSAPGLFPSGAAFIGNMEAGTAGTGEMDVFVGMKSMTEGHENDEKYGMTGGKVTLVYEDDEGKEYREDTDFTTTIGEPAIPEAPAAAEEEPKKAGQWWVSILAGGIILLGLAALLIFSGRRRGKRHEGA
jgi:hypothetical protein